MAIIASFIVVFGLPVALGFPTEDPVLLKFNSGLRYQYVRESDGTPNLIDTWLKASDLRTAIRYNPDQENVYHLFTRENPTVSQPLLPGNLNLLQTSNFNPQRRTIFLVHGWGGSIIANYNLVMIPAFLQAEDVNVIAVDWSAGAFAIGAAALNSIASGEASARFINWLNSVTGASAADYHIAGFSLGAHQAGVIGRNIDGPVPYVTAVDPGNAWIDGEPVFRADDGVYTEAIHTNAGGAGIGIPVAHVNFYPNGGTNMPGCSDMTCNHDRAYYYLAESLISGGFLGRECATYEDARAGTCDLPGTLHMGGLIPKTGSYGLYYLQTAAAPPFSLH